VQSRGHAAISFAVAVAYSLVQVVRHIEALHTVSVHSPVEVVDPIVVDKEAAGAVHMVVEAADPIVAHTQREAVRREVVVAHREVAALDQAAGAGLDHMTWMISSCWILIVSYCLKLGNVHYHTTGVEANRQVTIIVLENQDGASIRILEYREFSIYIKGI
jgi:hypothetical protein